MIPVDGSGNDWANPSSEEIAELLKQANTIAVVGLSANPQKPSHAIGGYLKNAGYKIIPVNPKDKEVLGETSYPDLRSISEPVDIVNVFRKPSEVMPIIEDAVAIGARAVWLQESVVSVEAFKKGEEAGLFMVMDRCISKEHSRLL